MDVFIEKAKVKKVLRRKEYRKFSLKAGFLTVQNRSRFMTAKKILLLC